MDTATLIAVDTVLQLHSIRAAARALGRPASTIAVSVSRFEAEISVRLVERAGSGLVTRLDAVRLEADIAAAAALARTISPDKAIRLDALQRFVEIVGQGSIRRAARSMGMGQPQLSRQIAQLETVLGTSLLERAIGGSAATPAGTRLMEQAEQLLAVWQRLASASGERFRKSVSTARLGSVVPLGYESEIARMVANLAARWLAERPRAPLFVSSTTADDLLAGLKSGVFDAALLDTDMLPPDLDGRMMGQTALAIVGGNGAGASIADALLSGPLAVPSARSGLRQRINAVLDDHLGDAKRSSLRLIEVDSIPVIVNLVLNHGFISVLPLASVKRIGAGLPFLPLPERYDLGFWLSWSRGNPGVAQAILASIDQSSAP